jgi:hypothetical protein
VTPLARGGGSQARMHMTHRALITRMDETPTDGYGGPSHDATPTTIAAAQPCYAWSPRDSREILDDDATAVVGAVRIAMPADATITEGDHITSIVDRLGRTVFSGPLAVTAVTPMSGHLAVMARVVRGGRM